MFGVSLLSIIVALGFEWAAHRIKPPRKDPPGGGAGASSAKEKVTALAMFQHWAHAALLLMSGLCWSVAFWPILAQLGWTWLVVSASIAFFVLAIGSAIDCIRDHKPDRPAFISARFLPTLLLFAVVNFTVLTSTVGSQVDKYQSNFSTPATHAPAKHK